MSGDPDEHFNFNLSGTQIMGSGNQGFGSSLQSESTGLTSMPKLTMQNLSKIRGGGPQPKKNISHSVHASEPRQRSTLVANGNNSVNGANLFIGNYDPA